MSQSAATGKNIVYTTNTPLKTSPQLMNMCQSYLCMHMLTQLWLYCKQKSVVMFATSRPTVREWSY